MRLHLEPPLERTPESSSDLIVGSLPSFCQGNLMSAAQCVQNSSVKLSFTSPKVSPLLLIFNKCLQLLSFVSCLCRFPVPTF